jgi:hypothetical protein
MQKGKNPKSLAQYGVAQDIGYVKSPHIGITKVRQD